MKVLNYYNPGGGDKTDYRDEREFIITWVLVFAFLGLIYGIALAFVAMLAAVAGEGSGFLLDLVASPFGILQDGLVEVIGAIVFWPICGALLGAVRKKTAAIPFVTIMGMHYGLAIWIFSHRNHLDDWAYQHIPECKRTIEQGIVFYGAGQAVIWIIFGVMLWTNCKKRRRA